ncbi:uncharacterized protein LOC126676991 [Mercurialis annua]|uniref:uncharacterized protein LOC126676991 n=1 Tax=Mercurialis annua TaxID=3986 RepID=UPI002160F2FC|nr:uncharacterized protein LOC126676991 [Mercurialis annua]
MIVIVNPLFDGLLPLKSSRLYGYPKILPNLSSFISKNLKFNNYPSLQLSSQSGLLSAGTNESSPEYKVDYDHEAELESLPYLQTLREFPKEELAAKVVMVRFDSAILLKENVDRRSHSVSSAIMTIEYLHESGAKIILLSDWNQKINSNLLDAESAADILSSILQRKVVSLQCISGDVLLKMELFKEADILLLENLSDFKEEVANCLKFAEQLSSGVDIFVNDSFCLSHKILASTVAICHFCSAHVAGFHFEESLIQLKKTATSNRKPYIAVIGGGNLYRKADALRFLASKCDGLVFVGMMAFQIMHALGYSVPSSLIEPKANKAAMDIIDFAHHRNISILYPKDFWCRKAAAVDQVEVVPAHGISDGWLPVDLGPRSLDEINCLLAKSKKIIWIGPPKFKFSSPCIDGASKLAQMIDELSQETCDVIIVGNMACKAVITKSRSFLAYDLIESASVFWEFFKGRKLPGIMALDKAYPFTIDWSAIYRDTAQPLVVDIGSGNGMFLLEMAKRRRDLNFLGLESNSKLVRRCLASSHQSGNRHFIATNATTTFHSIVRSYPGELILVSVQCPNPDFNNPKHRWRMLQRSLIEAVTNLLAYDGKVFLQSDIEAVALRMKELFLKYSRGRLFVSNDDQGVWLQENPFGVRSDWEQHVIDRGCPMYRLMLSKSTNNKKIV